MNLYYFPIFQFHNNDITNNNDINVHLTVIVSLRVPPLLAYDLSNLDVILLLFVSMLLHAASLSIFLFLSIPTTASLFLI